MSIYVEILVRGPMEALWSHTQTPALHERWDLRFSQIEYVPRNDESEPQRFQYTKNFLQDLHPSDRFAR